MRGWWRGSGCGRLGRRLPGQRNGLGEAGRRWTFLLIVGGELKGCFVGFGVGAVRLGVMVCWMMSVLGGELSS